MCTVSMYLSHAEAVVSTNLNDRIPLFAFLNVSFRSWKLFSRLKTTT